MSASPDATAAREADPKAERVLTVPNVITVVRLLCVPLFVWLLFDADERVAAFLLLGALGATDWVDGYVARRFDQGSDLGKVLDPTADRVLLLVATVSLTIDGAVPAWLGIAVLVREVVISVATLALAAAGARRIEVQWVGKAGTFALMFAFPGFLWLSAISPSTGYYDLLEVATWIVAIVGLALSYYAALRYVPLARRALREGRGDTPRRAEVTA
jgi:cardiolipin synthase